MTPKFALVLQDLQTIVFQQVGLIKKLLALPVR
jgi:hypothetical protein